MQIYHNWFYKGVVITGFTGMSEANPITSAVGI
jgi:hypothetical protein